MQANLRDMCQGRTSIAVAHRLSTIMMADEIIVMDEGNIVERGSHNELITLNGKYATMWAAQTAAQKENEANDEEDVAITANGI